MDDFIVRAVIAGAGIAIVAGALGCFVVWRRMAYFGDSLAHSALFGVALGLLLHFNVNLGIVLVSSIFAVLIVYLQHRHILPTDTLLGIIAHSGLSLGIVTISLIEGVRINLFAYLFGDILSIVPSDIYWIYGGSAVVLILLAINRQSLILMTVSEEIARAEGVSTFAMQLLLMALMTLAVALSIHIVGVLLITSLLIIPAAAARQITHSPGAMMIVAIFIGIIAVVLGISGSVIFDTPSGPSIVIAAAALFILLFHIQMARTLFRRHALNPHK